MKSMTEANQIDTCWSDFQSNGNADTCDPAMRSVFKLLASYEEQSSGPSQDFAASLRTRIIEAHSSPPPTRKRSVELGIVRSGSAGHSGTTSIGVPFLMALSLAILVVVIAFGFGFFGSNSGGLSLATFQAETIQLTQTASAGDSTATVNIET